MKKILILFTLTLISFLSFGQWKTEFVNDDEGQVKTAYITNSNGYILMVSNVEKDITVLVTHKYKKFKTVSKVKVLFNGAPSIETIDAYVTDGNLALMKAPLYMAKDVVFINNLKNVSAVTFYVIDKTISFNLKGSKSAINWALN